MRCDSQPRLRLDAFLTKVHILLRARIDDVDVDALIRTRSNVGCNDDKGTRVCCVPDAFCRWIALCGQGEFNGVYWEEKGEEEERKERRR